ncbi:MAG TPA: peroxiredoxin [candidate division Zixibacteria bacterium]|nr:peroxiredoxin [candidate division Zixibacteria bacterium]
MSSDNTQTKVKVGDKAPLFSLRKESGEEVKLVDFIGKKNIVLYFYPKDYTAGCTAEACSFRDRYELFVKAGAEVIGISGDSIESHSEFSTTYNLQFILLSDEDNKVRKLFGVGSTLGIIPGRVTYIIDKNGIVRHIFSSQFNPKKHVDESLKILDKLNSEK